MAAKKVEAGIKILNWITGAVIYESTKETIKEAVIDAIMWANNTDTEECLLWGGTITQKGYGVVRYRLKNIGVHRLSLILKRGLPNDGGLLALHSCNNRACVNHKHLRWGNNSQNMLDRIAHGTAPFGTKNHNHKLSPDRVRHIRAMSGSNRAIADLFNIAPQTVSKIRLGHTWGWL